MKRCAMLLATVLLWVCFAPGACIADAGAEGLEESEGRLYCMNCIHYREFIDWDIRELVQEDWSLTGLVFAYLTLKDGGDTLVACDIPHLDGDVELRRVSDEEYFSF
jgi:hypothetical protein